MAGRRPVPTALKILRGNPGRRPLNEHEPALAPGAPEKPKGLGTIASREWDFIVPALIEIGVLTQIDGKSLVEYCKAAELSELAYKDMRKNGLMIDEPVLDNANQPIMYGEKILIKHKANPAVSAWKLATGVMKSYLIEFGLTPASRAKLKIERPKEADPLEDMLNKQPNPQATVDAVKESAPLAFNVGAMQPKAEESGMPVLTDADYSFDA